MIVILKGEFAPQKTSVILNFSSKSFVLHHFTELKECPVFQNNFAIVSRAEVQNYLLQFGNSNLFSSSFLSSQNTQILTTYNNV
jgi:hypothetical protein